MIARLVYSVNNPSNELKFADIFKKNLDTRKTDDIEKACFEKTCVKPWLNFALLEFYSGELDQFQ